MNKSTQFRVVVKSSHTNQHNDQAPIVLLAQLVEHSTGIAKVVDSNPHNPEFFFRPYFHNYSTSVHYYEDHFHIHFSKTAAHIYDFHIFTVIDS